METNTAITQEGQLNVVKKLEDVLSILNRTQIKNKDSLKYIEKPLDDLRSSLKYLPTDPPFSFLPTEIKTDILGYLCNSGAIVAASVCQEWKEILSPRLNNLDQVKIGNHCSNKYECDDGKCYSPVSMLKAIITLGLNVPLSVCHPLTEIDPQTVSECLARASSLSIIGDCTACVGENYDREPILTSEQKQLLLVALENRSEIMEMVNLRAMDLNNLDQDRLVNFVVNKNRFLKLNQADYGPNLDIEKLVEKLKDTTDCGLHWLRMDDVQYSDDLAQDMADALCKVPAVSLHPNFPLKMETIEKLLENIFTQPIRTFCLAILVDMNWSSLIDPGDLKIMLDNMIAVELRGSFTPEQFEAARSCLGVNVDSDKGRISRMHINDPDILLEYNKLKGKNL